MNVTNRTLSESPSNFLQISNNHKPKKRCTFECFFWVQPPSEALRASCGGRTDERTDGRTDGWTYGWTDVWTDECMDVRKLRGVLPLPLLKNAKFLLLLLKKWDLNFPLHVGMLQLKDESKSSDSAWIFLGNQILVYSDTSKKKYSLLRTAFLQKMGKKLIDRIEKPYDLILTTSSQWRLHEVLKENFMVLLLSAIAAL